jgi:hypothetical protein
MTKGRSSAASRYRGAPEGSRVIRRWVLFGYYQELSLGLGGFMLINAVG